MESSRVRRLSIRDTGYSEDGGLVVHKLERSFHTSVRLLRVSSLLLLNAAIKALYIL